MHTTLAALRHHTRETPAEALIRSGPGTLADCELLSLVLLSYPAREARRLAHDALLEAGSLRALLDLPRERLTALPGFGSDEALVLAAALELGRRHLASAIDRGQPLDSPRAMARFFTAKLRHHQVEVFAGLFLDNRHRIIAYEDLARGTVDGTRVHAREVVRSAIRHNAAAVVFAHNHPSGIAEPSYSDRELTQQLVAALALVEVRVLDHLVIGEGAVTSFVERGLL